MPSGGIEQGETPEECCIREVKEETGYDIVIEDSLFIKETEIKGYKVKTYYFKEKKMEKVKGLTTPITLL
ncbi:MULTISPECIES: NUDIX hydrolase [unclassified Viridibacillus]|uniref:NUDIX hydrolase n=1 Tax=unclassified Viridibacillus TaxID=2617942 RepID=UPI0030F61FD6